MLIEEIKAPATYNYFKVAKAYAVGPETPAEMPDFLAWVAKNMPRMTTRNPAWTMLSFQQGKLTLKFYFSTEDLANRFLAYWPGKQQAA